MKKIVLILGLLFVATNAYAVEGAAGKEKECPPPPPPSENLAQIRSLEGRWVGEGMDSAKPGENTVVEYHVTSAGSAVEEHISPGTPHEMISMYYDVKGKVAMTHYCAIGNQPVMELTSESPGKLTFSETAASQSLLNGQMRMNGLTLEYPDKDTLLQTWTGLNADGTPMLPTTVFKLKRTT